MAYRLEPDEGLATGLRRVILEQAAAAVEHLQASGDPAGAVHEARKRSKEARAALRLLRGSLGDEANRRARWALRDAARRLAAARDAEAAVGAFEKVRKHQRLLRRERLPAELALRNRQTAAAATVSDELRHQVAADFAAAGESLPKLTYAGLDAVTSALARVYRRGRRRMRAAVDSGHDDEYHGWRHETKDLWYAIRLFEPAWPGPLGALAEELRSLSQLLGDEHDLTVLRGSLGTADVSGDDQVLLTPRLERAIGRRREALRKEAQALGARLWVESPRDFAARIAGYWRSHAAAAR